MSTDNSLSHTRWNCKYHIVFIPKYRRKVIYGKLKADIGAILRRLCEMKDVEIVEAHAMVDRSRFRICRIFERQKFIDDPRSPCGFEVQTWE